MGPGARQPAWATLGGMMPVQYSRIKASMMKSGMDEKQAKKRAAMTFVANGKGGTRSSRAAELQEDKPKRARATMARKGM